MENNRIFISYIINFFCPKRHSLQTPIEGTMISPTVVCTQV
jgi:hypothetical protein